VDEGGSFLRPPQFLLPQLGGGQLTQFIVHQSMP
jgi:hypothetical protein